MRRNPEQEFFHEHLKVHELPLTSSEEIVSDETSRRHRALREQSPIPVSPQVLLYKRSADSDPYNPAEARADTLRLFSLREKQRDEKTERSAMFEHFLRTDGTSFGWFGKADQVRLVEASDFDDRCNHTDCILIISRTGRGSIHLAIDAQVAHPSSGSLNEKRRRLENDVISGSLTETRYFVDHKQGDQNGPRVQRLEHLPRVVIGVSSEAITEVSKPLAAHYRPNETYRAYLRNHTLGEIARAGKGTFDNYKAKTKQELELHPLAHEIPAEICAQLESQVLLACNVYLDRATSLLEHRPNLKIQHLPVVNRLNQAGQEYRAAVLAGPGRVQTGDLVAILDRIAADAQSLEPLKSDLRYPLILIIDRHRELISIFGQLTEERSSLARDPKKEDPTIRFFTEPWETDADERRERERQLAVA